MHSFLAQSPVGLMSFLRGIGVGTSLLLDHPYPRLGPSSCQFVVTITQSSPKYMLTS